jgi:hypothetical protein
VAAALRDVLAGARDADALADKHNLDGRSYLIVVKTLEALAGEEPAGVGTPEPPPTAGEAAQMEAAARAFQAWLNTPSGQAALREVQAQGLGGETAIMALLRRFMAEQ